MCIYTWLAFWPNFVSKFNPFAVRFPREWKRVGNDNAGATKKEKGIHYLVRLLNFMDASHRKVRWIWWILLRLTCRDCTKSQSCSRRWESAKTLITDQALYSSLMWGREIKWSEWGFKSAYSAHMGLRKLTTGVSSCQSYIFETRTQWKWRQPCDDIPNESLQLLWSLPRVPNWQCFILSENPVFYGSSNEPNSDMRNYWILLLAGISPAFRDKAIHSNWCLLFQN